MRAFVAGQHVVTAEEFAELALGIDCELFAGVPGESAEERAARIDAARDMLAELREQGEYDEVAWFDALYAEALTGTVPLWVASTAERLFRKGAAA
jgi:hypothetical protein